MKYMKSFLDSVEQSAYRVDSWLVFWSLRTTPGSASCGSSYFATQGMR